MCDKKYECGLFWSQGSSPESTGLSGALFLNLRIGGHWQNNSRGRVNCMYCLLLTFQEVASLFLFNHHIYSSRQMLLPCHIEKKTEAKTNNLQSFKSNKLPKQDLNPALKVKPCFTDMSHCLEGKIGDRDKLW